MTGKLYLFTLIFFLGCATDRSEYVDIQDFYFPLDKLEDGMMFVYEYNNNMMPDEYWYLQTKKEHDSQYLNILVLRPDNTVEQRITEQIFPSGSKMIEYELMEIDSTGQEGIATLNIQSGNSFPFEVEKEGGVYIFQVKWFFPSNPALKYTLVRNRRYVGDTTFLFKGIEVPAIVMSANELIETELDGRQTLEFEKEEIYAKGLGLAKSKTMMNNSVIKEYMLVDTFPGKLLISAE